MMHFHKGLPCYGMDSVWDEEHPGDMEYDLDVIYAGDMYNGDALLHMFIPYADYKKFAKAGRMVGPDDTVYYMAPEDTGDILPVCVNGRIKGRFIFKRYHTVYTLRLIGG